MQKPASTRFFLSTALPPSASKFRKTAQTALSCIFVWKSLAGGSSVAYTTPNLRPLLNDGYWEKNDNADVKIWMGFCSTSFEQRSPFSAYFKQIPLLPPLAAPSGRRRARRRGRFVFFQICEKYPMFSFKRLWKTTHPYFSKSA